MWAGGSADATDEEAVSGSSSSSISRPMLLHEIHVMSLQRQKNDEQSQVLESGRLPIPASISDFFFFD